MAALPVIQLKDFLAQASNQLQQAGIESARLDCLIVLEDVIGKDRSWILAHPDYEIPEQIIGILNTIITQRSNHTPLAYIRGKSEFYGRTFFVDQRVLEPRPETESIIELLLGLTLPGLPVIVDVGTGSGALAITAKLELPQADVYAIDIDHGCLEVVRRNSQQLGADITPLRADLLPSQVLPQHIDVVLANLPYVPDSLAINQAATHEPRLAIFGGPDGLDLYRRMFDGLQATYVLTESLPAQHTQLADIAQQTGYTLNQSQGFVQLFSRSNGSVALISQPGRQYRSC